MHRLEFLLYRYSHLVEYAGFESAEFRGVSDQFAPHTDLKIIAGGKLTFDEMVVLHRVVW